MSRKNYDEIKNKFGMFINTWKTKEVNVLDDIFDKNVECYMSIVKEYVRGEQHSIFGIKNFILDFPVTDVFHSRICNYACVVGEKQAQQSAYVVCTAANIDEVKGIETFEFTAMLSNFWKQNSKGNWMINELRMDVISHGGNLETFQEAWYFENKQAVWFTGMHFPCINGELDSPWEKIKNPIDCQLTDREKIQETFAKYAFGEDFIIFSHLRDVLTDDVFTDMPPFNDMCKRTWITTLKFHRQKDRYWTHSGKIGDLKIDGDHAHAIIYRMSGHRQRTHPYVYTKDNINIEHACAKYVIDFRKENDEWKICRAGYQLGFIELGPYKDDLYDETLTCNQKK